MALQIADLRNEAGMTQAELAKKVGTTQQQISRLESPSYEGHSLSMLRRVADVLGAKVYVEIQRNKPIRKAAVAESKANYGNKAWFQIRQSYIRSWWQKKINANEPFSLRYM